MPKSTPNILVIDDDEFCLNYTSDVLVDRGGYEVTRAHTVDEALRLCSKAAFRLVITDLKMRPGSNLGTIPTAGGHYSGIALAREVRKLLPNVKIIIQTSQGDIDLKALPPPVKGVTYQYKTRNPNEFLKSVRLMLGHEKERPRAFIVHGRDRETALELKNYLQNRLEFPEPTILAEQASAGRTVIEKLEHYAGKVDVAFILLTPDDTGGRANSKDRVQFRARQNVLFELGYFFGRMHRTSGRVVVLYKGTLEIPSDLAGIVYIDITQGVEAAGEQIRREIEAWE
jgi:CheY-like chemotaxis protein